MTGVKMRAPVDIQGNRAIIALCDLVPGNTYYAIAAGRYQGQTASFTLHAADITATQQTTYPNSVRFTATATCMELRLQASDVQENTSIPIYLSVKCESCPEANAWKTNLVKATGAAVLDVQGGQSAEELITGTLVDGECFDVENVTFFGEEGQIGTFSNGATNIGFDNGIIIATGDISVAPGPNFTDSADDGYGNETPDGDLSNLTFGELNDLASIEFDFTPTETPVSFQFVFASEEYCEFVFSAYNDVFGFFISGPGIPGTKNIALVPGTNPPIPITINNLNHQLNDDYYVNNQSIFSFNLCGQFPSFDQAINEVQYDGFTLPLVAVADVIPCQTYHIKLKIADVGDGLYDSAVFLKAGSFDGGGDATVDFVVNGNPDAQEAYEGCDDVALRIDRVGSDLSQPVTVSFAVGGTATSGVDYTPIDTSYTIPAGEDQLVIPISIFADLLPEGAETIVLSLDNSCSCDVTEKTLTILDYVPMTDTTITVTICNSGDGATLTANPGGGNAPFNYLWSTNDNTQSIFVNPLVTTSYAVTITDACNDTVVQFFLVQVLPIAEITENVSFCPGGSVVIGDSTYTQSAVVTDTLPGMNGACDTVLVYNLTLLPLNTASDTIVFCSGDSVEINGVVYTQAGMVTDTVPGMGGACDTIVTYVLEVAPLNIFSDTIAFCPGGSVTLGDSVYTQPGTVTLTLPGMNGSCDTLATYVLQLLPQNTLSDTIVFCPGSSVVLGDSAYSQPATVLLVLPGANGACDTMATYILEWKPQVSFTENIAFCPGNSVVINGETYTQPGTVLDTLPGLGGACDTLATYILQLLPQVSFTDTITFCPGDTLIINGTAYTGAGTVKDTLPGSGGGCDTLATYVLVSLTPAPSLVKIVCPTDLAVTAEPPVVAFDQPDATTDCTCPGISLTLTEGLPSGSVFPVGVTSVCYVAKDSCGNTASCCFEVTVPDEEPCDEATIGCVKYELVGISEDDAGNNTYRIRVTNNCANKLMYAAFSLPAGVVALAPANNSVYTAPSGREYSVRNPNYSPFYSIRFKLDMAGIAGGESDLFEFKLPALSNPVNIHGVVRVEPKIFYETYLHTSGCTVEQESKPAPQTDWTNAENKWLNHFTVFPNPTSGSLFADLSDWQGTQVKVEIFDSRGQRVQQNELTADAAPQEIQLPEALPNGLYFFEILLETGEKQAVRFLVQR